MVDKKKKIDYETQLVVIIAVFFVIPYFLMYLFILSFFKSLNHRRFNYFRRFPGILISHLNF